MSMGQSELSIIHNNVVDVEIDVNKSLDKMKIKNKIHRATKRSFDIVASVLGLIMLLPITLFVAISNFFDGDGKCVFFTQLRIGKNGKVFKMYKYRTMIMGAEDVLMKHIEEETEMGKEYVKNKKIKNDPRITRIGRFLRKTSLDEFPQFINVLKGEMSLVGPRPYLPIEKEDMGENYNCIINMKPGITGPWQVAGRSNLEFEDRLKLDVQYYKDKSILKDIKLLLKTFVSVFRKEGAM